VPILKAGAFEQLTVRRLPGDSNTLFDESLPSAFGVERSHGFCIEDFLSL
jgi:hypothetical protein